MKVTIITVNNHDDFILDLKDMRVEIKDLEDYQLINFGLVLYNSKEDVVQYLDMATEIGEMNEYDYLDNLVSPVEFLEYVVRKSR